MFERGIAKVGKRIDLNSNILVSVKKNNAQIIYFSPMFCLLSIWNNYYRLKGCMDIV